jgi:hypothetical protein
LKLARKKKRIEEDPMIFKKVEKLRDLFENTKILSISK